MFLSHNIVFKGKNRAKVMHFIKLAILIFGCPGDMHITNCTRMPQHVKAAWMTDDAILGLILAC